MTLNTSEYHNNSKPKWQEGLQQDRAPTLSDKLSSIPPLQTWPRVHKKCELHSQDVRPSGSVACKNANLCVCSEHGFLTPAVLSPIEAHSAGQAMSLQQF